jgi:PAS domain S-box-containing protein
MGHHSASDEMFCASLADFFSNSNVGLAVFDEKLRYQALNPWLANVHGCSIEFHLGKTTRAILGEIAAQAEPAIRRVFVTGRPVANVEIAGKLPAKTETERWVDNFFPIKDATGAVRQVGVVVVPLPPAGIPEEGGSHQSASGASAPVLRSWKEIAGYVGACAKTVQRWEHTHKFPVRRVRAGKGAVVFAIRDEIDNWLSSQNHGAKTALGDKRSWATFINSPLPTLIVSDDRIILDANLGIANLIGTTADHLVGKSLDNFARGADVECTAREWLLFRKAGASVGLRNFYRADGTVFAAEYTLRTMQSGTRILTFTALRRDSISDKQIFYQAGPVRIDL